MIIAHYIPAGGIMINHDEAWVVKHDKKVIAHIRKFGTKWRVYRIGRNGVSNDYDSAEKAARAFGLLIDEWTKEPDKSIEEPALV